MIKILPSVIGCLGLMATSSISATTLKSQEQKASYVIGVQLATQLIISKDDIDLDAMKLGNAKTFLNGKQT